MESGIFDQLMGLLQYDKAAPMLFNSGFFLFFFFFCILFYQFIYRNQRAKVFFLLTLSLYFYYKSSGFYFVLVIISSIIDFIAGHVIHNAKSPLKKKFFLILSLITNLGLLGYFKYTNFIIDNVNSMGIASLDIMDIFLPVGISFFTFQSMSYTIDVYRGKLDPEQNFFDFLFFVSFFPQLVAGPIVRASTFLPQIHVKPVVSQADIGRAVFLIVGGLFKKAVIADYISINFVDRVFEMPLRYTGVENLLALYGYALQIYCDFSGYSDMAIGLALLLGFKLPINFDSPYQAKSITEFWRRWHISLSSWLKDYLYIPLGGNRKGKERQYVNLLLTMLLGGLWHGASWKFVVWGAIHGAALALEKLFGFPEWVMKNRWTKFVGFLITFHIANLCWIFFRAQSFEMGMDMLEQIFTFFQPEVFMQFIGGYTTVFVLIIIGYILHFMPRSAEVKFEGLITRLPLLAKAILLALMIFIVAQFKSADIQPFIYFQF
ncbi:MAG: MBOAT family protein [Melioribacteraceae bacterium]|nr:MBOAT family protein [Melioribacteraceae bacterium]MCF8264280.1 MBOAT family protein [Melioribacteraceae bacterium]MCF8412836.1 MBOAT family protein [Melioribacteraceae bacterium]MCF8431315.1 MBOAT family protein [Melioribacteraceae bacterium]